MGSKNKKRVNGSPAARRSGAPGRGVPPQNSARRPAPQNGAHSGNVRRVPQSGSRPGSAPQRTQRPAQDIRRGSHPQMSREQQRRTDRAYNRATVHRSSKGRKRGSRGRNYSLYYMIAIVLIIVVLIVLANTVLFKCSSIEVEGNSRYTAEQIIAPSGIETGENLLHIDIKDAESRIKAALSYIDDVEVKRSLPTKIKITVKEAEKWFLVTNNGVTGAVSRMGRIVELGSVEGLPLVEGYDPADIVPGAMLESRESGKTDIPSLILSRAEEHGITGITNINMTDRFNITIDCGDNVTLLLGGVSDIDGKMSEAAAIIAQESSDVSINLHSLEKVFVRDKVNGQTQPLPETGSAEGSGTGEAGTSESSAEGTAEAA